MFSFRSRFPILLVLFTVMLGYTPSAHALTLNISMGQLLGASDVDVNGTLFDVTFRTESCIALFDGCDDPGDFTFQTQADAVAAGTALLNQVFTDTPDGAFDSNPSLTIGCSLPNICGTIIPYEYNGGPRVLMAIVINSDSGDNVLPGDVGIGGNSGTSSNYALFAAANNNPPIVPEPTTGLLLASGLLGLAGYRWSQRRREGTQVE